MENYLTQIANYLLTQSWQIAILVAVIAALNLALKNKSAHVRYLLWLIVLAKCLVPPLVTVPLAILPQDKMPELTLISNVEMPAVNDEMADTVTSEPLTLPSLPVTSPTIMERLARVTARQWLGFGWIVGVAAFLLFAVVKALRTNNWLRRDRKPLPDEAQTGIEDLFLGLGFRTLPKVWLVEGIGQPFVWGLLRGSIYLPANFVKVDTAEHRRGVLGHELGHILRFDAAVNILQIITQAVFWFHPFVWWANKRIRAEREKCCDEMAIARLGAKVRDYSIAIVNTLIVEHESTRPVPSLAVAGPVKNIEERIKTIMKPEKKFYERPSLITATVVLLLALLTVPTALVLTARAETKAVGKRKLLVTSKRTGNFEIFLMNEDGTEAKNLTNHDAEDGAPDWSPDGKKIVFASNRSNKRNIYVMDADGSNVKRLTHKGEDYEPTWSPDGEKITFRREIDGQPWQIFVMNADGSNQIDLIDNPSKDAGPDWSPDGKKIAFSSNRDIPSGWPYHLYVMDANGANVQRVSPRKTSATFPAWSPDGKKIAYTGFPIQPHVVLEIFVYDFESGNDTQLTTLGGLNTYVAWSPDGNNIVFQHYGRGRAQQGDLYIMDADGSNQQQVLTGEAFLEHGGGQPAWRPK